MESTKSIPPYAVARPAVQPEDAQAQPAPVGFVDRKPVPASFVGQQDVPANQRIIRMDDLTDARFGNKPDGPILPWTDVGQPESFSPKPEWDIPPYARKA